ncbi:hypothetical protein VTJ83DRAFT_29 [Remersonia thermophila]|uniref:Uncharacterized protein n=1 Tax=Remersonia thermophila TaxID=72144 RepID=A0ABR4DJV2_9PEZI
MRLSSYIHLLFLPGVPGAAAWNHISSAELEERLQRGERTLVAYIHPLETKSQPRLTLITSKPSQALEPVWASLEPSPSLSDSDAATAIVSIDCSLDLAHCLHADVASYPAIRLILPPSPATNPPNGNAKAIFQQHRYRGPRTAPSILAFLHRMTRRPSSSSSSSSNSLLAHVTAENMTSFLSAADGVVFLGRFGSDKPKPAGPAGLLKRDFELAARRYRDRYTFGVMTGPAAAAIPAVECRNNEEGVHLSLSAANMSHPGAVESFVERCAEEVIPELTRRNELGFYETGKSIVHFFPPTPEARAAYVAEMRPLAQRYAEYLHFVTTDPREFPGAAEMLGLRGPDGLSVQNPNTGDVYPYRRREKISAPSVEAFLGDIIQGTVQAWRPVEGHDEL